MSLYSDSTFGSQVIYAQYNYPHNGTVMNRKTAEQNHLVEGGIYAVTAITCYDFYTDIKLQGFKDAFNSVQFDFFIGKDGVRDLGIDLRFGGCIEMTPPSDWAQSAADIFVENEPESGVFAVYAVAFPSAHVNDNHHIEIRRIVDDGKTTQNVVADIVTNSFPRNHDNAIALTLTGTSNSMPSDAANVAAALRLRLAQL